LPSISTYTLGFSDIDSQTLIKNISVSDSNFINTVLKTEGGNVEITGNVTATSAIINFKKIEDRDHFHYASSYGTISKSVNQAINFNLTKRGSGLVSEESFIPKYTGLYSISCSIFLGTGSTGALRLGVNINGTNYNLNGGDSNIVCANTNQNADGSMLNGNMIVDSIAGQTIRLYERLGAIKYLAQYSYFHGYYIGSS
jgi:hypothetical protein